MSGKTYTSELASQPAGDRRSYAEDRATGKPIEKKRKRKPAADLLYGPPEADPRGGRA